MISAIIYMIIGAIAWGWMRSIFYRIYGHYLLAKYRQAKKASAPNVFYVDTRNKNN